MSEKRTRVASPVVWICDWDIGVGRDRFRFYRGLKKIRKEMQLEGQMSTMSVLITVDRELASRVYELARAFTDRVHLYEAREQHTCDTTEESFNVE